MPDGPSPRAILAKVSAKDRGLIELPVLVPHLHFHPVDAEQTILVSESFNTLLRGRIYHDLLPLLDGRRTQGEIAAVLSGAHTAADVRAALVALASSTTPTAP